MDGQFGSGVYYSPGETEVSVSCLPSRARMGKLTPAPSSNTGHLLAKLNLPVVIISSFRYESWMAAYQGERPLTRPNLKHLFC